MLALSSSQFDPKPTSAQSREDLVPAEHGRNEASIGSPTS
jgi:hypothetical protein